MTAARETVLDADKPAAPVFCVLHGGCAGAHLALPAAAATVGRALDNDIVLDAAGVAERHLTLRLTAGVVTATATALVITLAGGSTGAIDLGMDRPFRVGSCVCVVTLNVDGWLTTAAAERVGEAVAALMGWRPEPAAPAPAPVALADAGAEPLGAGMEIPGKVEAAPQADAGGGYGEGGQVAVFFRRLRVISSARLLRTLGIVILLLLAAPVTRLVSGASDSYGSTGTTAVAVHSGRPPTPAAADSDPKLLQLRGLLKDIGIADAVTATRTGGGGFELRGFVLTNSDYVRLLSGLSLVGFPVEMEVENRGSQLNALKLLIADMPGADLHVEFAPDNQGIDVKGVVPTVADQQRIIRSIRQEMPSLRNITFQIDSPEETAKSLAAAIDAAGIAGVRLRASRSEIVIGGEVASADLPRLKALVADSKNLVPVLFKVATTEQDAGQPLTMEELGIRAVLASAAEGVVVDSRGRRLRKGEALDHNTRIAAIGRDELWVYRDGRLTPVTMGNNAGGGSRPPLAPLRQPLSDK